VGETTGARVRALGLGLGLVLLFASPAGAQSYVLNGSGARGSSSVSQGVCKYGNTGLRGILGTSVAPPVVSGANRRRRRARERTWVRYKAELVDVNAGHGTLAVSGWSGWIRVSEAARRTWTGTTGFTADWRGKYRVDVLIEWWTSQRRIGWRWHRVTRYGFFDQYNTGPYGPISSCHHFQVEL
jgi:hypothetical protein